MVSIEPTGVSPGKKLRLFRLKAGITQDQLASGIGYESGSSMISQIERGLAQMSMEQALKAARFLKVHPSVLLAGEELSDDDLVLLNDFLDYLSQKDRPNLEALKILMKSLT